MLTVMLNDEMVEIKQTLLLFDDDEAEALIVMLHDDEVVEVESLNVKNLKFLEILFLL